MTTDTNPQAEEMRVQALAEMLSKFQTAANLGAEPLTGDEWLIVASGLVSGRRVVATNKSLMMKATAILDELDEIEATESRKRPIGLMAGALDMTPAQSQKIRQAARQALGNRAS